MMESSRVVARMRSRPLTEPAILAPQALFEELEEGLERAVLDLEGAADEEMASAESRPEAEVFEQARLSRTRIAAEYDRAHSGAGFPERALGQFHLVPPSPERGPCGGESRAGKGLLEVSESGVSGSGVLPEESGHRARDRAAGPAPISERHRLRVKTLLPQALRIGILERIAPGVEPIDQGAERVQVRPEVRSVSSEDLGCDEGQVQGRLGNRWGEAAVEEHDTAVGAEQNVPRMESSVAGPRSGEPPARRDQRRCRRGGWGRLRPGSEDTALVERPRRAKMPLGSYEDVFYR
jgi:hypothetical protein